MLGKTVLVGGILGAALGAALAGDVPASPPAEPAAAPPPATAPAGAPATRASDGAPPSGPATLGEPGPDHPRSLLDFRELGLELGVAGAWDRRSVRYDARGRQRGWRQVDRALRLEETVGLRGSGALLGADVAPLEAAVRWGLGQERIGQSRPGPDALAEPDGDLLEYDLSLTLLPRGRISGTAYASRVDSRLPRAFQPSLDRTLERYGGGLYFQDATLPMRLTFEHVRDELTSRTADLLDEERRGRDTLRYEATWQISPDHALRLEYEYDDRRERYAGSRTRFDTVRNYLTLDHTLRFGPDRRSSWQMLARLQDESGELGRDLAELSARLRLQHTDALATHWSGQLLHDAFQQLKTGTWRGEGGLTHQLGQTLTSTLNVYGLQQQAEPGADFLEWGTLASAAFSRENALGRLAANLAYAHTGTDTRHGRQRGIVIGESVTLRDPLVTYLAQPDIQVWSLVVTDATRSRTFLPGRDYAVVRLGPYTGLRRVATGQIADRQTVLVSYTYAVFGDYDLVRDRLDARIQQDFRFGLSPYYAASIQNEDLDRPAVLGYRGRNVNRHRLGATYRRPRWSAGAEVEYNDDAVDPYQAVHANGDVVLWQSVRQQLDGKATLSQFWFDGSDGLAARDTLLVDVGAAHRCLLGRGFEATGSALYRYEDDSLYGVTHGVDLTAALEWRVGHFALRIEAEYDLLTLPGSRDNSAALWVKLRRDVPLLTRSGP